MKIDLATTKTIVKFVVARSVSGVVVTALHNLMPEVTKTQKVQVYIGAWVCGAMVADAGSEYVNKQIDEIAKAVKEFKNDRNTDK